MAEVAHTTERIGVVRPHGNITSAGENINNVKTDVVTGVLITPSRVA